MSNLDLMRRIDSQLSHVWMVRAFLKHCDEAEDNAELCDIHRALYDYMLALGAPLKDANAEEYLKLARKKLGKLRRAAESFAALQPQVSTHTNFQMAVVSLNTAVAEIETLLGASTSAPPGELEEDWSE